MRWRVGWVMGCVLLLHLAAGRASMAQAIDLRIERGVDAEGVHDYAFSWVYWWETNGQAYLREAVADRQIPDDGPASRRFRGEAVAALMPLLDDTDPQVREQAVIALARIGHVPLENKLFGEPGEQRAEDPLDSAWLIDDPNEQVRCACWVAMGLLETERARAVLAEALVLPEPEQAARVAGIGLLSAWDDGHLPALMALLTDSDTSVEVKRWIVWAVDRHADEIGKPRRDAVLRWSIDNVPSPFVLSQVLMSRDFIERNGGTSRLIQTLRYYPDVRELPGYQAIRGMPEGIAHGSSPMRLAMETRVAATLTLAQLPPPRRVRDRAELRATLLRRAMAGNRGGGRDREGMPTGLLDFNRGIDTIAFAMHSDAGAEDLAVLYDLLRGFTIIPADQAQPLDPDTELTASDLLNRQSGNEVRGYAAIAIGLLIRRETEGTSLYDAWPGEHLRGIELDRLKRRFGQRLSRAIADTGEPRGYRAACALALGLTGDPAYIAVLTEELGRLQAGDEAVLGYGLLALALLGDERAAGPVQRYVTRRGRVDGVEDLLGRRSAMQALAVLGERAGDDARTTLEGVWGRDPWVSIEAGRTTHWTGLYDAMPKMLTAARSASPRWRVAAAMSMGAALDSSFPARIEALSEGQNFTLSYRRTPPTPGPDDPQLLGDPQGPDPFNPLGLPDPLAENPPPSIDTINDEPPTQVPIHYPPGWPIPDLSARGNPFLFHRLWH